MALRKSCWVARISRGRVWSTGEPSLVRTRNVRRDPRCSLFVFGPHPVWAGLETEVTILDGPDAPFQLIRLLQARHSGAAPAGHVLGHDDALGHDRLYREDEYVEHARAQRLLVFEFGVRRAYGNY